jgi:hypothetical protein
MQINYIFINKASADQGSCRTLVGKPEDCKKLDKVTRCRNLLLVIMNKTKKTFVFLKVIGTS